MAWPEGESYRGFVADLSRSTMYIVVYGTILPFSSRQQSTYVLSRKHVGYNIE